MRIKTFHAHGEPEKVAEKLQEKFDKMWPPDKLGPAIVHQTMLLTPTSHRHCAGVLAITYLEEGEEMPGTQKPRRRKKED